LPVVATRAKRDEIFQVVGCATVRYRRDVVNLEPAAKAAPGTAVPVTGERG
jgi:hypothetical protein